MAVLTLRNIPFGGTPPGRNLPSRPGFKQVPAGKVSAPRLATLPAETEPYTHMTTNRLATALASFVMASTLMAPAIMHAQTASQDAHNAGQDTKNAAVDTGHATKKTTKKAYHKT
ncbi:MAG: hypothetical protein INR62_12520, partial [Rhodospirillales bacterium]|nr:hypothetical protein [Acetobacter sp.]